ncbi:uncharacterized protein LOC135401277 [Ornithodoros turicata]|uniref:uncharacterized protein LOC135401277 n=1 Tax=Ornithodoros turicata TaxID=34597 RepID=UPI0031398C86
MADKMMDIAPPTVCAISPQPSAPSPSDFQELRDETGKRERQQLKTVSLVDAAPSSPRLFYITDRGSGARFLVDTGAEVCVIPASRDDQKRTPPNASLQAVNGSPITTYGEKLVTLNFGLRRVFRWIFVIAKVPQAIIGADFLAHFGLLVDMSRRRLIDRTTSLSVQGVAVTSPLTPTIRRLEPKTDFEAILHDFPDLTQPPNWKLPVKHHVVHHIVTSSPPVHVHPRRLTPEKFKVAKEEFKHMLEL